MPLTLAIEAYDRTQALLDGRGALAHHFGVAAQDVTWVRAGRELVPHHSPLPVEERPGANLWRLLAEGGIDAVISPDVPQVFEEGRVGRLFVEFAAVERALWRKTHVYPIMHTVAIFEGRLSER